MNATNSHLVITHGKINWIFTAIYGQCNICESQEPVPVMCYGNFSKNTFQYMCKFHLSEIACKKQLCNHCNKKALLRDQPRICQECMELIINNYISMMKTCKFPDIARQECQCTFCMMTLRK